MTSISTSSRRTRPCFAMVLVNSCASKERFFDAKRRECQMMEGRYCRTTDCHELVDSTRMNEEYWFSPHYYQIFDEDLEERFHICLVVHLTLLVLRVTPYTDSPLYSSIKSTASILTQILDVHFILPVFAGRGTRS